ncbi:hypothetical protein FE257_005624 [Aspergillus nanangensis]|uniref:RGS domain-containing protein n=1 Tax=Aspergillus nanangensis TaxID=2582783 RepID=A0AAD4GVK9_ASPNN|nr:hypothetical protein FE257_005624 [Aspergillus nanangensis]
MAQAEETGPQQSSDTPISQPYSTTRPAPEDILAGNAPEPYTFESFVDYLSQNHCIETLDFLADAKIYIDTYRTSASSIRPSKMTSESRRLGKQWKTLMSTYIAPGAPDELNIPKASLLTESALMPFIQSYLTTSPNRRRNNDNKGGVYKREQPQQWEWDEQRVLYDNNNGGGDLPGGNDLPVPEYRAPRQIQQLNLDPGPDNRTQPADVANGSRKWWKIFLTRLGETVRGRRCCRCGNRISKNRQNG